MLGELNQSDAKTKVDMPRSLIENMNGKGKVFEGQEFVADVTYNVRMYQNYSETKLLNGDVSRTVIGGDVEISISPFASVAHLLGNRLTLHMSDGRWGCCGKTENVHLAASR